MTPDYPQDEDDDVVADQRGHEINKDVDRGAEDIEAADQRWNHSSSNIVAMASIEERHKFIRSVYSIILGQLGLSIWFSILALGHISAFFVAANTTVLFWSTLVVSVAIVIVALSMVSLEKWKGHHTFHCLMLGIFSLSFSMFVSVSPCQYPTRFGRAIVLQTLWITFAMVLGLTLCTLQSSQDLIKIYAAIYVVGLGFGIISIVIVHAFLPFSRALDAAVSFLVALLLFGCVNYMRTLAEERSLDECIICVIQIYLYAAGALIALLLIPVFCIFAGCARFDCFAHRRLGGGSNKKDTNSLLKI